MPDRISDELLAFQPVTQDEHARALKELVHERVMQNRRKDADEQQDAALARLAEEEAKAAVVLQSAESKEKPVAEKPAPAAKPKAKTKEK